MSAYFDLNTWPLYLLGFITFCATLFDDVFLNSDKPNRPLHWYIREFIYTLISIAAGISISIGFELSKAFTWVIVIVMGLCGSNIIRQFLSKKEKIIDNSLDAVDKRIQKEINGKIKSDVNKEDEEE